MLCKFYWIVLYTVHFTAFSLGGRFFSGHGVVSKSVCSVNNRGDIFGTTYVIGIHAVCFHGTLIKGAGSRRGLYNFWGGSVLLYNIIWGGGCRKMDIFVI